MIPQHISQSTELYTPSPIVEAARELMGGIDLDPASSWVAQRTVGATKWFGLREDGTVKDGLSRRWRADSVFLNPPGGRAPTGNRACTQSSAAMWWWKLVMEWRLRRVTEAVFVGFSLEIMRSTQDMPEEVPSVLAFPFCVPQDRVQFEVPRPALLDDGTVWTAVKLPEKRKVVGVVPGATNVATTEATNANLVVYLPPHRRGVPEDRRNVERFVSLFSSIGEVRT